MPVTETTVTAECGTTLREGDRAYNYYDCEPGVIGKIGEDGWFFFAHDNGSRALLNGARIASMAAARRYGYQRVDPA